MKKKQIYTFGNAKAEGNAQMKELLGGKGANLAEMNHIGIPVPPGFTITTEACMLYTLMGKEGLLNHIKEDVREGILHIEEQTGRLFGNPCNPLLVSVRSGARESMPGMMDTVLNLGINDEIVEALVRQSGNERFAWDTYRRFIQMYGNVVMGIANEDNPFEKIIQSIKKFRKIELDSQLSTEDFKIMIPRFKQAIREHTGQNFPMHPWEQLWETICAVFNSWMNERAVAYRQINHIPQEWGTAVNVQAMVFGNMGNLSATGVAFTRNAATGENIFNGEYLINAQGEDVVAGIRTPHQITLEGSQRWAQMQNITEEKRTAFFPSLEETMPGCAAELIHIEEKLENYFKDMQDIEFTIENGKLWILQTRTGKRTGQAMVKIAMDLLRSGDIDEPTLLKRMNPQKLDELLHPVFQKEAISKARLLIKGLAASPGAASGEIVFTADKAREMTEKKHKVILVRAETSPEDLNGMMISEGILTQRGGMTSHAAVVARGMGKCCICGAGDMEINLCKGTLCFGEKTYKEGEWISLNGSTGEVFEGKLATTEPELSADYHLLMSFCEKYSQMDVRTNADTPKDARIARKFGAKGIGLCRTEHMFFDTDRIKAMREMILSRDETGRREALNKLLPMQRNDFEEIFAAMDGYSVTIRLLDPPLHEFVPHQLATQKELADDMGLSIEEVKMACESLREFNPMLGHRGCRLGCTYPEITEMQARAIIEAAIQAKNKGISVVPEIMVPLVGVIEELKMQSKVIRETAEEVFKEKKQRIDYKIGTMIEVPRAALTADKIAQVADFFSFGTNDLTQMTFGYSRDDAGKFLKIYQQKGILKNDPFTTLDREGVGSLVQVGVEKGRATKPGLKIGLCGEHGGEPSSVEFCNRIGLNYVSCSPFRVPVARLAAAKAAVEDKQ